MVNECPILWKIVLRSGSWIRIYATACHGMPYGNHHDAGRLGPHRNTEAARNEAMSLSQMTPANAREGTEWDVELLNMGYTQIPCFFCSVVFLDVQWNVQFSCWICSMVGPHLRSLVMYPNIFLIDVQCIMDDSIPYQLDMSHILFVHETNLTDPRCLRVVFTPCHCVWAIC